MMFAVALQLWNTRGSIDFDLENADGASCSVNGIKANKPVVPVKAASSPEALQAKIAELESVLGKVQKPEKISSKSTVASWSEDLGLGFGWTVPYFSALPVW